MAKRFDMDGFQSYIRRKGWDQYNEPNDKILERLTKSYIKENGITHSIDGKPLKKSNSRNRGK